MKKLIFLLALLTLSCSKPDNTTENQNKVVTQQQLHVPAWLQGNYYRTNAFGGAPISNLYRLIITTNSIETEYDQTIAYPNGTSTTSTIKEYSMTEFNKYYSNLREDYTTVQGFNSYRVYGNDISQNGQNVLIYYFYDGYPNCIMFRYPEYQPFRKY